MLGQAMTKSSLGIPGKCNRDRCLPMKLAQAGKERLAMTNRDSLVPKKSGLHPYSGFLTPSLFSILHSLYLYKPYTKPLKNTPLIKPLKSCQIGNF